MNKTIRVKGIGRVTTRPDYIEISMALDSKDMVYEEAMELAAEKIDQLTTSLMSVGFEKQAVKTTDFKVRTDYEYEENRYGHSEKIFTGFIVRHSLKIAFDFSSEKLSETLSAIGNCLAQPELSIAFTVKDPTAVNDEMLRAATLNARRKAEILCEAAGKKLGDLLSIDYNWDEIDFYSDADYSILDKKRPFGSKPIDFEPEDIDVSDTAVFIWEML